ncbi:hypothetical protein DES41_110116 [Pseudorhodoferax soli]|uniref:Uncharacterized protein n=2 Tax=Pseudorhodoferax soli TaxID=545864 RepID=A0A368XFJ2_9BURK|nr:hypothetical protein DES41_110116 [Pseudorhodoferax soli]
MKKWTLESPGAGIALHLLLFALVVAAVQYSEHRAASVPAAAPLPAQGKAVPARPHHASAPAPHVLPVVGAVAPQHPTP